VGDAQAPAPARERVTPAVHVSVGTGSVGLGDPFAYVVEARGTAPVRVTADTGPFSAVAAPQVTRTENGCVEVVRVTQRLICVDRGCAPGGTPRRVLLPTAHVTTGDDGTASGRAAITLVPRVPAKAVAAEKAQYVKQLDVPAASSPVSAGALAALLVAAAVILVLVAAFILVRGRRHAEVRGRRVLGLADALRLLRESAGRPTTDRRRAADLAGRLAPDVHAEAMRVAWAPPDPQADDVAALASRIEGAAR
jgi:hypothetical protein